MIMFFLIILNIDLEFYVIDHHYLILNVTGSNSLVEVNL